MSEGPVWNFEWPEEMQGLKLLTLATSSKLKDDEEADWALVVRRS
jgi:hypothetical protein